MSRHRVHVLAALATMLLTALAACDSSSDPEDCEGCGSCQYEEASGVYATTERVQSTTCDGVASISATFTASDDSGSYDFTETAPEGSVYETACLDAAGLAPGDTAAGTLDRITTGTCSPVGQGSFHDTLADCLVDCP